MIALLVSVLLLAVAAQAREIPGHARQLRWGSWGGSWGGPPAPTPDVSFDKNVDIGVDTDVSFDWNTDIDKSLDVSSNISSSTNLDGAQASALFESTAVGNATFTEADVITLAVADEFSETSGFVTAAANNFSGYSQP